jgi:hypothetical protein
LVGTVTRLRAGVATADFTPGPGVAMSGFGARTQPSAGAHDPLTARAVAVSSEGDGGDPVAAILVVADLVALSVDQCDRLRAAIAQKTRVSKDGVVVTVTHTHAGPHITSDALGPGADPRVTETVEQAIIEAAARAWAARAPARWGHGRGEERTVAHNRRQPDGPIDPTVTVVRIDTDAGAPLAVLFSYSCHPVVLGAGNLLFSADWPGFARVAVEEAFPGATAVFLQGCCGQINTGHSAHNSMDLAADSGRTFDAAEAMGRRVGEVVGEVAAGIVDSDASRLAIRSTPAVLPLGPLLGRAELDGVVEEAERELATRVGADRAVVLRARSAWAEQVASGGFLRPGPVTLTAMTWGGLDLVTLPGEPFVGFSTEIRDRLERDVLVLGYANGVPGYLPYPPDEYALGGYEVEEAHYFYGQDQCFDPDCGPRLVESAVALLRDLPRIPGPQRRTDGRSR